MIKQPTMAHEPDSKAPFGLISQSFSANDALQPPSKRSRLEGSKTNRDSPEVTESPVSFSLSDICFSGLTNNSAITESICCITKHTINSILHYLRVVLPNNHLGFRDISSSCIGDKPESELQNLVQLPSSLNMINMTGCSYKSKQSLNIVLTELKKLGYVYFYKRQCLIHLSPEGKCISSFVEVDSVGEEWEQDISALAHFSFYYASKEKIEVGKKNIATKESLVDSQNLLLFHFVSEYRSSSDFQGSTNKDISSLEEDVMTTFGDLFGSSKYSVSQQAPSKCTDGLPVSIREESAIARDLKIGAILALNDKQVPFNMEFLSGVTGNTYYFHHSYKRSSNIEKNIVSVRTIKNTKEQTNGISRIHLSLEDKINFTHIDSLRQCNADSRQDDHAFHLVKHKPIHEHLLEKFRLFHSFHNGIQPMDGIAQGKLSRHQLLLDESQAGKVYVDGELILDWNSEDNSSMVSNTALFGFDLIGIRTTSDGFITTTISDYNEMKSKYSALLCEILTDASQGYKQVAEIMLNRLMNGVYNKGQFVGSSTCMSLESELMSNKKYDPVGIAAKALCTQFTRHYGKQAYPCRDDELTYAREHIGYHRKPIIPVPQQALDVFRRGGFLGFSEIEKWNWFTRYPKEDRILFSDLKAKSLHKKIIEVAVESLQRAEEKASCGFSLIENKHIAIVRNEILTNSSPKQSNPDLKYMCRYNEKEGIYYVNDEIFHMKIPSTCETKHDRGIVQDSTDESSIRYRSYFLGYCIAQSHKNPNVLFQFLAQETLKSEAVRRSIM